VDAVDTVTAKIEIIKKSKESNVPVISSMGTGNKLNPVGFKVSDISKTKVCPLARVMRNELKKRGISKVKCVYSEENPVIQTKTPASVAFVPPVAGLLIASEVIEDLIKN
jgi:tRNA A37 threonylcarbamoyladenosine dehydratase